MLADISRQAGGQLRGIAVWAYNVRGQGLYNDGYQPPYKPDQLFATVTAALPAVRQIMDGPAGPGPNVLVLAPNDMPDRLLGAGRVVDIWAFRGYNFADLVSLVRTGVTTAVVGTVDGESLSRIKMLVVIARGPEDLTPQDVAAIRAYRQGGGTVVDASTYDGADQLNAQWVYPGNAPELFFADSYPQDQASPAKAMGLPRFANSFVFVGPRELVVYGGTSLDPAYKMQAWVRLPFAVTLTRYSAGAQAEASNVIGPGLATIATQRHAYALAPLT
ncbi:MAG TPA: hypothetical protein VFX03_02210, partial [Thermomicrobiales bacterium]|nr:hypothetical protein [Thermomicrobiales bacterium]